MVITAAGGQHTVILAYVHQTELLLCDRGTVCFDEVVELHIFRVLGGFTVYVHLVVYELERITRHTDTTLHVILPFVDRAVHYLAERGLIQ